MPSRLTLVPGSQGPRHSGSVARATWAVVTARERVPTARERVRTMICSQLEEMSALLAGASDKSELAAVASGSSRLVVAASRRSVLPGTASGSATGGTGGASI